MIEPRKSSTRRSLTGRGSTQSAALPYRVDAAGKCEFLLVTTRKSGRWSIPKGGLKSGMLPHRSAAREAYEEAGIIGVITGVPIGKYHIRKNANVVEVSVFGIAVTSEVEVWPEMHERQRRWFSSALALRQIADVELRSVIEAFARALSERMIPDVRGGVIDGGNASST